MWARLSIVAGLVLGIAVAALVLGGLVALTPGPTTPSTPTPANRPTAVPSVVVSAAPSASLAPSASPPGGSPTAPAAAAFDRAVSGRRDAIALPVDYWVDAAGIVRDGAPDGIGPDAMAAGSKTILPGVDVTP